MIYYCTKGHALHHEVQTMIQVFYPNRRYVQTEEIMSRGITVVSEITAEFSLGFFYADGNLVGEKEIPLEPELSARELKRVIKTVLHDLLREQTGYTPQWGIITGIRPAKFVNELLDGGMGEADIRKHLQQGYLAAADKTDLAVEVAKAEGNILALNKDYDYSLYIGIPFCPTRCLYCSFTSYPINKYADVVDLYLDNLIKEMTYTAENMQGKRLMTLYVGGGTPTSLNEAQLERLLHKIKNLFSPEALLEYTVEAGRPDTITSGKLSLLKAYGVNRISINPQTMNDKTLELIGRSHTSEQTETVFHMARAAGFDNINMDLILGLPEETLADTANTLKQVEALNPDSVTVHTLAVKRASRLKEKFDTYALGEIGLIEDMIALSRESARRLGMKPYYMYRQKNMTGNFENVGYCRAGAESFYNVEIMEEKQTIIALGAGGTTKVYDAENNRLDRIFNVKMVEDYNRRIDEMIERKNRTLFTPMNECTVKKTENLENNY